MPGPLGSATNSPVIDAGTLQLVQSRPPGALAHPTAVSRDFLWLGDFDRVKVAAGFSTHLKNVAHFDARSVPDLLTLIGFLESDVDVIDLRCMAYMLATAYWETSHVESVAVTSKDKKGRTMTRQKKHWANMKPVEETGHGAGRQYHLPVKVKLLDSGDVLVTEQDGDQFTVQPNGKFSKKVKGAAMGSSASAAATQAYLENDGSEHAYFGRGYVQLTWWSNYAMAGANMDRGLEFLLDPDQVMDPENAYAIMSFSMRTGKGFANGHKLSSYFAGAHTNYIGARAMVNGSDCNVQIARIAQLFETVLYEGRQGTI